MNTILRFPTGYCDQKKKVLVVDTIERILNKTRRAEAKGKTELGESDHMLEEATILRLQSNLAIYFQTGRQVSTFS